jgi:RNA polymerase sigma factor (sigma-70 family)
VTQALQRRSAAASDGPSQTGVNALMVPALTGAQQGPYVDRARESERGGNVMAGSNGDAEKARRFRDAALPHLDEVYTLARYLLRNSADADDAVQECYLRALRHFDSFRGQAIKPWLMAILRNACRAEFARRAQFTAADADADFADNVVPLWQEPESTAETELIAAQDGETIRSLLAELPLPFRETIVLRDINGLSYREIAEVIDAPVGTVMSRLARGRSLLRAAWRKSEAPTSEPTIEERSP